MGNETVRVADRVRSRVRRLAVRMLTGPYTDALRWRARRADLTDGVTVIAVNFNTLPYMKALVAGVRRHSSTELPIHIIDNASTDASKSWASEHPRVRFSWLPVNVHHGPAMDIGILRCRTTHFIAIDVDAFPVDDTWLDRLLEPLRSGAKVVGAGYPPIPDPAVQPYVHACCLAMSTRRFVDQHHTFSPGESWDTAQSISMREWPNIHPLPITSSRGPGILGSVFGGVVYHNFYSARFATTTRDRIDWVDRGQPEDAWAAAMRTYFPDRPDLHAG